MNQEIKKAVAKELFLEGLKWYKEYYGMGNMFTTYLEFNKETLINTDLITKEEFDQWCLEFKLSQ